MNLRGRNKISPDFNMSSMTDIVFLLLVFFMLSSPTVTPEALDLILPKAKGKTTHNQNLAVSIDKNKNIFIGKEKIAKEQLKNELRKRFGDTENPTIILRTAKSVAIQEAVDVMAIAKANNYKVVLAVKPN